MFNGKRLCTVKKQTMTGISSINGLVNREGSTSGNGINKEMGRKRIKNIMNRSCEIDFSTGRNGKKDID